jgi:hypothetical protein
MNHLTVFMPSRRLDHCSWLCCLRCWVVYGVGRGGGLRGCDCSCGCGMVSRHDNYIHGLGAVADRLAITTSVVVAPMNTLRERRGHHGGQQNRAHHQHRNDPSDHAVTSGHHPLCLLSPNTNRPRDSSEPLVAAAPLTCSAQGAHLVSGDLSLYLVAGFLASPLMPQSRTS